jgi:hypothetical protein
VVRTALVERYPPVAVLGASAAPPALGWRPSPHLTGRHSREVDELELQGWPGSWGPRWVSGWARRTSRHGMQISIVNRPSISLKGPLKVPQ